VQLFLTQFDDGKAVLDKDITPENIGEFVAGEQLPLVVEFNDEVCLLLLLSCVINATLQSHKHE